MYRERPDCVRPECLVPESSTEHSLRDNAPKSHAPTSWPNSGLRHRCSSGESRRQERASMKSNSPSSDLVRFRGTVLLDWLGRTSPSATQPNRGQTIHPSRDCRSPAQRDSLSRPLTIQRSAVSVWAPIERNRWPEYFGGSQKIACQASKTPNTANRPLAPCILRTASRAWPGGR